MINHNYYGNIYYIDIQFLNIQCYDSFVVVRAHTAEDDVPVDTTDLVYLEKHS